MIIVTLGFCVYLYHTYVPYDWGIMKNTKKNVEELQKNGLNYNVLFFGNSRVQRQIDPALFDAVASDVYLSHSYNLGVSAQNIFEEYYYFKKVLESGKVQPGYAVIQITTPRITSKQHKTSKIHYWIDWHTYLLSFPFHYGRVLRNQDHRWQGLVVSRNYLRRLFNVNVWRWFIENYSFSNKNVSERGLLKIPRYPLAAKLLREKFEFTNSNLAYGKLIESIGSMLNSNCGDSDEVYINDIVKKFIEVSTEHHVYPIFIVPPPRPALLENCVLQMIPDEHKISFPSMEKLPSLYRKENIHDRGHFNEYGAEIYTEFLAGEFKKLLQVNELHPASGSGSP